MSASNLAGRYAKALFELAEKDKSLDKVESDLIKLVDAIKASDVLSSAIHNPVISKQNISGVMSEILKKIFSTKLTSNFIGVLVNNGRVAIILEVAATYFGMMMESRGEEKVFITTAEELQPWQVKDIEDNLGKTLGKKVKAVVEVNKDILGGIVVRIGSKMVDASLSGQLEKLAVLNKKAIADLN